MDQGNRLRYLSIALYAIGGIMLLGLAPLMMVWPEGFAWNPAQSEYEQMMVGVYATLGVFLIIAARDPLSHRSLIWFAVWSSVVHGGIMLVQALADATERANLLGDIPALLVSATVLAWLMPRSRTDTAGAT